MSHDIIMPPSLLKQMFPLFIFPYILPRDGQIIRNHEDNKDDIRVPNINSYPLIFNDYCLKQKMRLNKDYKPLVHQLSGVHLLVVRLSVVIYNSRQKRENLKNDNL
jgi:hypothetical protein